MNCSLLVPLASALVLTSLVAARPTPPSLRNDLAPGWPAESPRAVSFAASALSLPANEARCLGPQKLLVIRVDFSDVPGEPVSVADAQRVLDEQVKPFIERASYGQTTIVSTVSSKVYRMPRTAATYAYGTAADGYPAMNREYFDDAAALAGADYVVTDYSRVIIAHSAQLHTKFPDSKWSMYGLANLSEHRMWIGEFSFEVVAHELCHTYGACHSNFWEGAATDPVAYTSIYGYGDPTDIMGERHTSDGDLAPWQKYLCGWLPDAAVQAVTTSGTYRVYRFDAPGADLSRPLALRFSRDNIRYYWLGLRGGQAETANGAYVGLALHGNDDFNLLDLAPPYRDARAAVLPVGATFEDAAASLKIRVVAQGGTGSNSYLDVEVTLAPTPRPSLVGWGKAEGFEAMDKPRIPVEAVQVAAGKFHTLALRPDGTVWAGPEYPSPIIIVPDAVKDVVSVAAGHDVSAAIGRDGTLTVWGPGFNGLGTPPAGLRDVRAVAFGERHALALRTDGTVVSWGTKDSDFPSFQGAGEVPAEWRNIVAIDAGRYISAALTRDGRVLVSGRDTQWIDRNVTGLAAIACGAHSVLGLRADGTIAVIFNGDGMGRIPAGLANVKAIGTGDSHAMALLADGTVVGWSGNTSGTNPFHDLKVTPPAGVRMRSIDGGAFHSVGALQCVGSPVISAAPTRTGDKAVLSWQPGAGATAYRIDLSPLPTFATFLNGCQNRDMGTAIEAQLSGLDPAVTYYYRVHSISAAGYTAVSNLGIIPPAPALTLGTMTGHTPAAQETLTLTSPAPAEATSQWLQNGRELAGGATPSLRIERMEPGRAGLYTVLAISGAAARLSNPAIVGLTTDVKVIGSGDALPGNIIHPNGNVFNQVLLTGAAEAITADHQEKRITRTSFIDLDGDIVQVEFAGPGTLSLVLDGASTPSRPGKYNQAEVQYVTGHAGIVIAGADENTHVSVFTVGRATAFDPTGAFDMMKPWSATNDPAQNGNPLFRGHPVSDYDGIADIAFIAISSTNGRFGGVRTANTHYFASRGFTGIYAPGVTFTGPVYIGNISAFDTAEPVLVLGSAGDVRIPGGDMLQDNGRPVQVSGITELKFTTGGDSHGRTLAARPNDAVYLQGVTDVTAQIVRNP